MTAPSASPSWSAEDLLAETGRVRALARHLVRAGEDPDDLAQDALVAALEQGPARDRALRPWLAGVLRRRLAFRRRSAGRRRARERAVVEVASPGDVPPTDELVERAELCARVVRALTGLREPLRGVLLLRYFADLAPAEIARRRGVPAATVRSQLHRGLAELRAELEAGFGGDGRRTDRALLALAATPASTTTVPATPPLLWRLRAMNPATQALVAGTVIVVAGGLLRAGLSSGGGAAVSPEPAQASAAGLVAATTASERDPAPAVAGPNSAASQDEAVVEGVLRDTNGQPVPAYLLELRHRTSEDVAWSACAPESVWTDEAGHFATEHAYPAGELSVRYLDHPDVEFLERFDRRIVRVGTSTSSGRDWTPGQAPLSLKTAVGPTFDLQLSGLEGTDPATLTGTLEAVEDAPWGPQPSGWILRAPVRAGEPPWIRFVDRYHVEVDPERPWWLRVATEDGLRAAEAQVPFDGGAGPLALALAPSARLDVSVVAGPGVQDPSLAVESVPGGSRRALFPVSAEELPGGGRQLGFSRGGLAPGTVRLLLSLADEDQLVATLTLEGGEALEHAIDLSQSVSGTTVAGELRSQSGTMHEQVFVTLLDAAGEPVHFAPPRWEQHEGEWVAPFAIDNVPPEGVELRLAVNNSHRRWSGLPLHVLPPQEGLVLVCQDGETLVSAWLRIVDASTGERLSSAWGRFELAGCEDAMLSIGVAGMCFLENAPLDAVVEWYAAADGHAPRWGGPEDLTPQEDGKLGLEVTLEPGWGARLRTVRAGTLPAEPLAGVSVLLDGEPAGVTDAQGELVLSRETAPERVEVALEGWTYAGGDLDAASGQLAKYRPWHVLRFAQ